MKAVLPDIPEHILEWRRQTGADRWDEMWEGVLHTPPAPNPYHQDLEWELETWLRTHWASRPRHRVYHNVNVGTPGRTSKNYRIPDLILLSPTSGAVLRGDFFEGPPVVVVEIESPGDETRDKMPFYAELGVPEAWIIGRDTRIPEICVWKDDDYAFLSAGVDGWIESPNTGIRLRGERGLLAMQMGADEASRDWMPETEG